MVISVRCPENFINKHSLHTIEMSTEFIEVLGESIDTSNEVTDGSIEFNTHFDEILSKYSNEFTGHFN